MNAPIPAAPARTASQEPAASQTPKRKASTSNREYAEFLPAALEISTLPPPRVVPVLLSTIILALAAGLVWSSVSVLDVYTSAAGRVRTTIPSAVVQPQESGRIIQILAENGKSVVAGDPLVVLDEVAVRSALRAAEAARTSWRAEISRRKAALAAVEEGRFVDVTGPFDPSVPDAVIRRETDALRSDLQAFSASLAVLQGEREAAEASRNRIATVTAVKERLLAILDERVRMQEALQGGKAGSRAELLAAQDQMVRVEFDFADTAAQGAEVDASLRTIEKKTAQTIAAFLSEQAKGIQVAERQIEQLDQEIIRQKDRRRHLTLRAPITGTVQQLAVASTGQVVNPGQPLMIIVPSHAERIVEALVPSSEIGFVGVGDPVVVKADAFPFTRYGTFAGTVIALSDDAVTIRDAASLQDPGSVATGQASQQPSGIPAVAGLYFVAQVELQSPEITINNRVLRLEPGMTVRVEIHTESRSVIDYVLSPVSQVLKESGHER
jgi:hemolysin D